MLYELIIVVFLMLIFCFAMQILTIKVMFTLINAKKTAEMGEIKPISIINRPLRKPKKSKEQLIFEEKQRKATEEFETVLRNLDRFDGTGLGQEEV